MSELPLPFAPESGIRVERTVITATQRFPFIGQFIVRESSVFTPGHDRIDHYEVDIRLETACGDTRLRQLLRNLPRAFSDSEMDVYPGVTLRSMATFNLRMGKRFFKVTVVDRDSSMVMLSWYKRDSSGVPMLRKAGYDSPCRDYSNYVSMDTVGEYIARLDKEGFNTVIADLAMNSPAIRDASNMVNGGLRQSFSFTAWSIFCLCNNITDFDPVRMTITNLTTPFDNGVSPITDANLTGIVGKRVPSILAGTSVVFNRLLQGDTYSGLLENSKMFMMAAKHYGVALYGEAE